MQPNETLLIVHSIPRLPVPTVVTTLADFHWQGPDQNLLHMTFMLVV